MFYDVTHTITDGLMGFGNNSGTGVHIKIGASPVEASEPIVITSSGNLDYIHQKLGYSPLADAVMDSIENGSAKILCIPMNPSADGNIIRKDGIGVESSGAVTVTGKPNNKFSVIILITGKGVLNTASFKYSINGGYTYSDEISVPLSGYYEIPDTGLTAVFTLEESQEYEVGDTYLFETTAPQLTNEDVIAGCEKIRGVKQEAEFVHIVGSCSSDSWAAVSKIQEQLQNDFHKPMMFVLEAFEKEDTESMQQYKEALEKVRKKVKNFCIQVVTARGLYTGMDGLTRDINFAGIICGLYAKVAVNKSIGETAVISLSEDKVLKLLPEGITDTDISELDDFSYLTIRQYDGLTGYYVNNARMMGPDGTDYKYAEDTRVVNKIIRETRKEALLQLQSDIDLENPEADLQAKAQFIQAPLDTMVKDKEISFAEVIIPEDAAESILMDETLLLQVRYVQRGIIRNIVVDVGKKNPYAE